MNSDILVVNMMNDMVTPLMYDVALMTLISFLRTKLLRLSHVTGIHARSPPPSLSLSLSLSVCLFQILFIPFESTKSCYLIQ